MSQSLTEQLAEHATDALHQAIFKAWVAGYDKALEDMNAQETYALHLVKESGE